MAGMPSNIANSMPRTIVMQVDLASGPVAVRVHTADNLSAACDANFNSDRIPDCNWDGILGGGVGLNFRDVQKQGNNWAGHDAESRCGGFIWAGKVEEVSAKSFR